ncbi:hypothetical protein [Spirosoma fluminis]
MAQADSIVTFQEFGNQARPARLVAGPQAMAGVAVEVLLKPDMVLDMRVGL